MMNSIDIPIEIETETETETETESEIYLKKIADKANMYYRLYTADYNYNNNLVTYSIIPIIIISTFTGTATIFQPYVNPDNQSIYLIIIGCCNIIAGLLTLLKEYFRLFNMEQTFSHVAIPFNQLYDEIRWHLALRENDRGDNIEFIHKCNQRLCRMLETSPYISKYAMNKIINDNYESLIIS